MNDGDKALVLNDKKLIKVAERNMKDVVPLYYEMKSSIPSQINSNSIYYSLTEAYKVNIGTTSNKISKVWSSDNPNDEVVKWLTVLNNFLIDQAKSNFKLEVPKDKVRIITEYTKKKLPHFFMYAKDKESDKVEEVNNSTVNRLNYIISAYENEKIDFVKVAGEFDFKLFLRDKDSQTISKKIVDKFVSLHRSKRFLLNDTNKDSYENVNEIIREEMREITTDTLRIVDSLVLHNYTNGKYKIGTTLWNVYGDILYRNLQINLGNVIQCEKCGMTVTRKNSRQKYCQNCSDEIKKEKTRLRVEKFRGKM